MRCEIAKLEEQKQSLTDKRPFVWSIEFAEIFFDRGGFDIIIGNPPYVRQEDITDPNSHLEPREYKKALLAMVRMDFPEYFAASPNSDAFRTGRKPSGHSDLYTYFYIRSLRLLNPGGVHVFICSNSWLDVDYGSWLQEFFLRKAPLHFVFENRARRSFTRADVNTIITVASAPNGVKRNHKVRFVAFKKPFEEVVLSENLLEVENAAATLKNENFRVHPITVEELLWEGSEINQNPSLSDNSKENTEPGKYIGDKWGGKYLRAPDIFFTILEKGKGKLARLGSLAEVRRGYTTGANEFFYLEPVGSGSRDGLLRVRNGAGWEGEIEREFLKPVIKSPRECRCIVIKPEELRYLIFMCSRSKTELKGTRALEYIKWGEEQGYSQRPTCRTRTPWWNLGIQNKPIAVWLKAFYTKFLVPLMPNKDIYVSDRFYVVYPLCKGNWAVALNDIFVTLTTELFGRSNLGEGALDNMTYEAEMNLVINPELLNQFQIINREIHDIFTECGIDPYSDIPISEQEPNPLPDRKALDDIVFDALGLTDEERKDVYRAVCQLVWERISRARSV